MKKSFLKTLIILVGISISIFILAKSESISSTASADQISMEEPKTRTDSTNNYSAHQLFTYSVPGLQFIKSIKLK